VGTPTSVWLGLGLQIMRKIQSKNATNETTTKINFKDICVLGLK
jgi:hypothetical protein